VHLNPSRFIADSTSSAVMPGRINAPISVRIVSGATIFLVLVVAHPSTNRTRRHAIRTPFPIVTHESFNRLTPPFIEWRQVKFLKIKAADPPLSCNGLSFQVFTAGMWLSICPMLA
jgi:hypothetical protein